MKKVTQADIKKYLRARLYADKTWTVQALLRIYDRQTFDEQIDLCTKHDNSIGFTGYDAKELTKIAKWCKDNLSEENPLPDTQLQIIREKMPKYWKQIWNIGDQQRITQMVIVWKEKKARETEQKQVQKMNVKKMTNDHLLQLEEDLRYDIDNHSSGVYIPDFDINKTNRQHALLIKEIIKRKLENEFPKH